MPLRLLLFVWAPFFSRWSQLFVLLGSCMLLPWHVFSRVVLL